MSEESRREFLLKLARRAVYAAPVVRTLSAPETVVGQANPSQKGMGEMKGFESPTTSPELKPGFGPSAPWTMDP